MIKRLIAATCLAVSAVPASATVYNYTFTAVDPSPYLNPARDYGLVNLAAGTVIGQGTFVTSGPAISRCVANTCGVDGYNIAAMTGTFQGEAVSFTPNPHPGQNVTAPGFVGNDLLYPSASYLADAYGLVFSTASMGYANLLGLEDPDYIPYEVITSHRVPAPTRTGTAAEHYYGLLTITEVTTTEIDGGTQDAPTVLPSASISAINGTIGPENLEQFYQFDWNGGLFTNSTFITDAASTDTFKLFLNGNGVSQVVTLDSGNDFSASISQILVPGKYTIGLAAALDVDPAFTMAFGSPLNAPSEAPEPATWAMTILGFGLIGGAMRRRLPSRLATAA